MARSREPEDARVRGRQRVQERGLVEGAPGVEWVRGGGEAVVGTRVGGGDGGWVVPAAAEGGDLGEGVGAVAAVMGRVRRKVREEVRVMREVGKVKGALDMLLECAAAAGR